MYEEIKPTDVKDNDKLIIVDLATGTVYDDVAVYSYNGNGCFNYTYNNGVKQGNGMMLVHNHATSKIYRQEDVPKNWPPQEDDVWGIASTYSPVALYHVLEGKMRCKYGHVKTPDEFLKTYRYKGLDRLVLLFRDGKAV